MARANIDKLVADGKLVATSTTDLAKSGVGVAVRAGLPKPDLSSGDSLKAAVLAAKSVAYSSGPSGHYVAELFKKMGIADQIKDKVQQTPSGVQVGDVMARGDADPRLPAGERADPRQRHRLRRPAAGRDPAHHRLFRWPARRRRQPGRRQCARGRSGAS